MTRPHSRGAGPTDDAQHARHRRTERFSNPIRRDATRPGQPPTTRSLTEIRAANPHTLTIGGFVHDPG
jgi:hypothetical protein